MEKINKTACRECGEQVSAPINICPKCGTEEQTKHKSRILPLVVGLLALYAGFLINNSPERIPTPEKSLATKDPFSPKNDPPKPAISEKNTNNHTMTAQALASCVLMAANTYRIPAAVLIGIMHVEQGHVGEESPLDVNKNYVMGPMHISSQLLPKLADTWKVDVETAHKWVRDDGCVNIHVAAYILRQKVEEAGNLFGGIAAYHSKNGKPDNSYANEVIKAMDDKGLIMHDAPLFIDEPGANTKQEVEAVLRKCLMHSVAIGDNGIDTMHKCIDIGILWCNKNGLKTSPPVKISPITGKIFLDNQTCAARLNAQSEITRGYFESELMNYIESENHNYPYHPNLFDIRKVWGWQSQ